MPLPLLRPANALGLVRTRAYQQYVDGQWRTNATRHLGQTGRQQQFIIAALERSFDRACATP